MTRKEFLQTKINDPKWSKTLRPLRRDGKQLKPYALMSMKEKYAYYDIHKIGYLDIETENLNADFGVMWSYVLVVRDVKTDKTELRYDVVNKSDFTFAEKDGRWNSLDARILGSLMEDISDCDCLIGHWFIGKHRHDIPYIRSRCAINNVSGFPKHKMIRYGDTQKWGSQIHRLHSYGLESVANAYNISIHKTRLDSSSWQDVKLGLKQPRDYILDHNIKDSKITHQVHTYIEDYVAIPSVYC